jgi:hypothetical protein
MYNQVIIPEHMFKKRLILDESAWKWELYKSDGRLLRGFFYCRFKELDNEKYKETHIGFRSIFCGIDDGLWFGHARRAD